MAHQFLLLPLDLSKALFSESHLQNQTKQNEFKEESEEEVEAKRENDLHMKTLGKCMNDTTNGHMIPQMVI